MHLHRRLPWKSLTTHAWQLGLAALLALNHPLTAATYDAGPGQTFTNLASVPWTSLAAGDTVNIHYQPGGYHEIILLANSGVPGAPITINGVPDPVTGALPTLDGQNAVTATNTPWHNPLLNTLGVLVISHSASQPYGYIPSWIVIQNLHVQNASPDSTILQADGTTNTFDLSAAGIYAEFAQHLVIENCEINASANGFYCGSENGDVHQLSAAVLVQHSWLHGNGYPGNYNGNELSTEAKGIVFQYNLIGPLRGDAYGYEIEDRSSGTILRYNEVIQGAGGAAFWFVQTTGGIGTIDTDPAYHTNYVYGNVFLNPPASGALGMFVYDANGIQGQPRNGTLYFYNNTVVNYADQSGRYGDELFELPSHAEVLQYGVHDVLDCRNNIFATLPVTPGAAPSQMALLVSDDSTLNLGTNWVSPGTTPVVLPYGATNFFGAVTGTNQLLYGDRHGLNNPGFASVASTNFQLLAASPAMDNAGPQAPGVLAAGNLPVYEYADRASGHIRAVNGLGLDLGAFEGISTNAAGPLFTLTVSNGFGSGLYPAGATVPLTAADAPAGEAFAGWTNAAVADPGLPGTSVSMPASALTVTATFTNLPVPVDYPLTVVNGTGSGAYAPGTVVTIGAGTPPAGQTFTGWSGYAVMDPSAATTTLTMPAGPVTVIAGFQAASSFHLTVINGSGSGVYPPGTVVGITANPPPAGDYFSGWSGFTVTGPNRTNTTLTMPGADVIVAANYLSTNSFGATIPYPVSSHPRLWITTNDLPRLRAWATDANPIYLGIRTFLTNAMINYDTQYFPGGTPNATYPDLGDSQGYIGLITEEDALVFALFSLIDPDVNARAVYAQRGADLIRVALTQAALGPLAGAPFRDPGMATYNRANATLKLMPLAVDWLYNAVGTNGQPVFSAADKRAIRDGFYNWCEACRHASTAGGDSPIPDVYNDPAQLCPNNAAYRLAANNYYIGHARMMTLMSLAIDPADDPPLNPALPVSVPTNSLRSYIGIANGAWLFQEYAMFGEGPQVAADYGLPGAGANFGEASGGLPPEGMLYGASMGAILNQLLALHTAGFDDPTLAGPQIKLINAPVWDRFCDAWLSALNPKPRQIETYLPTAYQMFAYGDTLRLYTDPDFGAVFSSLAMLDAATGNTNRLAKTSWLAEEAPEGGYANLLTRASTSWGANESYEMGILYFLSLDPAKLTAPADPRPSLPTLFYDRPQGNVLAQSDWSTNRSMLHWRCSWTSINHQNADGGMFQFLRQNEFLTKEFTGYDANDYGQCSYMHNTLALQNHCPAGTPGNLGWFEAGLWATGSQWQLAENSGDPTDYASTGTNYLYTYGDLTKLYNRPSPYTPENALLDIVQANRSLLWLKPDHLVVYDRATSRTAGLFKRFNLCLPAKPVVTPLPAGGSTLTETLASGQQLFIHSLLPTNGTVSLFSLSNAISTVAEGEPDNWRLAIEDTNNPTNIRFLHVLQGADAGAAADPTTYIKSTSGNPFEGVVVRGAAVLFPVELLSNNFTGVSYTVPLTVTNFFVTGLGRNTPFTVAVTASGGAWLVTVSPGGPVAADNAGLLAFDPAGHSLAGSPAVDLTPSANPAGFKAPVNYQAFLPVMASGSVTFLTNGVTAGSAILAHGQAGNPAAFPLPRGTNLVTVVYLGDGNYPASTNTLAEVVTNHPPVAGVYNVFRSAGLNLHVFWASVATNWTDVDGDPVTLAGVNLLTTNGITVQTNSSQLLYNSPRTVPDQICYTITDGQGGTNTGVINVMLNPFVSANPQSPSFLSVSNGALHSTFLAVPNYVYQVQRSTNLGVPSAWVTISTNTATTNGLIHATDTFPDLGGQLPSAAYYRLVWQP